jgi:hypothetical protein
MFFSSTQEGKRVKKDSLAVIYGKLPAPDLNRLNKFLGPETSSNKKLAQLIVH